MYPLDLDRFRQLPQAERTVSKPKRPPRHRAGEWFLKGPIPGEWLQAASRQPGCAINVGLALWYLVGMDNRQPIRLTRGALGRLGVSRHAGRRGLLALERAGLVEVVRHAGRCPMVTLLAVTVRGVVVSSEPTNGTADG